MSLMVNSRLAELDGYAIRLRRHVRVAEPQAPYTKGPHIKVDRPLRRGRTCFVIYIDLSYLALFVI